MQRLPARALQWQAGDVVAPRAKGLPGLGWRANMPIPCAPALWAGFTLRSNKLKGITECLSQP